MATSFNSVPPRKMLRVGANRGWRAEETPPYRNGSQLGMDLSGASPTARCHLLP
jgi:hypothetical protein